MKFVQEKFHTYLIHVKERLELKFIPFFNLQNGCNFHAQDRLGNTALMYAAMKGRDELMNFMVDTLAKVFQILFIEISKI